MPATLYPPCTQLSDGEMIRLRDRIGAGMAVSHGRVWVTQVSDPRDHLLTTGERFNFDRPGLAIVQAVGDACVQVLARGDDEAAKSKGVDPRRSAFELDLQERRRQVHWLTDWCRRLADEAWRSVSSLRLTIHRRRSNLLKRGHVIQC